MRGMLLVLFGQKLCKQLSVLLIPVQYSLSILPFVIAGLTDSHELTEKGYWIFFFHFFNNFVFAPCPVTYSLFAPAPSTQYPFFNRAISISCLATNSRNRSNSDRFLLRCNAANLLPGRVLGSKTASPPLRYSFVHRHIIPVSVSYSFANVRTEKWSSRCLCTISSFCSIVHFFFFCPFFIVSPPNVFILA